MNSTNHEGTPLGLYELVSPVHTPRPARGDGIHRIALISLFISIGIELFRIIGFGAREK